MAAQSKQARYQQIHSDALQEFDEIQSALRDERLQCLHHVRQRLVEVHPL
mgnify:CR=1 FL=1